MLPQSQERKKKNSSKVNLFISFAFHSLIVVVCLYLAARNGILGNAARKFTVDLVKAEKPPEKPPEKPKVEPKIEQPKEMAKAEAPKMEEAKAGPPPDASPAMVVPPSPDIPSFFDGGHDVETSSDVVQVYKGYVEYALRSRWDRPDDMDDNNFVVEVAVEVDRKGNLSNPVWQKSSGNQRWDDSVRQVLKQVTSLERPPPTNFPSHVTIRFDVQEEAANLLTQ